MIVRNKPFQASPGRILITLLLYVAVSQTSATAQTWKWIAYGDTRSNDADHRSVLQSMVTNTPDYKFVINVGDVVDDGAAQSQWDIWQLACDDVLGGTGQNEIPPRYMSAPGNHDATETVAGLANWNNYLSGQLQQFGNEGKYFTFDYENARFIILDSDKSSKTGAQYTMLMDAIENNPQTWLFVIWHHPIFAFGEKSYQDFLHDTWGIPLYTNGCDIIFMGHAHYYVRSKKLGLDGNINPALDPEFGTVQVITGNGGAPPYALDPDQDGNGYLVEAYTNKLGYTELTVAGDTLYLRHILTDGTVFDEKTYTPNSKGIVSLQRYQGGTPDSFFLNQNYPNPFNPTTTINFDLPPAVDIGIVVYDLLGREVVRLVDGYMKAGYQQAQWDGRDQSGHDLPSGIYIARLVTPEYSKFIKMVLLK